MHIAFDAKRLFHNFTGLGNYSRTLVANLKHYYPETRITLFTPKGQQVPRTEPFYNRDRYELVEGSGTAWRTWGVYKDVNTAAPDIFHGLSHQIPFSSDKLECKTVVTVHDLMQRTRPKDFGRIDRMIYERKCKYACQNADMVIAISEHTKSDIMKYYRTPSEKIKVVYQACDPQFGEEVRPEDVSKAKELFSLPERYFLYVGSLIPRKNLLKIVEAMSDTPQADRVPLVVIGSGRKYMGKVVKAIEKADLGPMVHFMGDVPFELFPAIYQESIALIYPSHYEGFGLPVIEALSVGAPVITSKTSSLPEAGGDQAIYVDPSSTEEMKAAMLTLAGAPPPTAEEIASRKTFVRKFAPETTARHLMDVYQKVLGG